MSGASRATNVAEQLELCVRTEILLLKLSELEAMESELIKGKNAMPDVIFQHDNAAMLDEENKPDEELDSLRGQLKQEKAYNHWENQAHQQKVRKLQQMLQKVRKTDASLRTAWRRKLARSKQRCRKIRISCRNLGKPETSEAEAGCPCTC